MLARQLDRVLASDAPRQNRQTLSCEQSVSKVLWSDMRGRDIEACRLIVRVAEMAHQNRAFCEMWVKGPFLCISGMRKHLIPGWLDRPVPSLCAHLVSHPSVKIPERKGRFKKERLTWLQRFQFVMAGFIVSEPAMRRNIIIVDGHGDSKLSPSS